MKATAVVLGAAFKFERSARDKNCMVNGRLDPNDPSAYRRRNSEIVLEMCSRSICQVSSCWNDMFSVSR